MFKARFGNCVSPGSWAATQVTVSKAVFRALDYPYVRPRGQVRQGISFPTLAAGKVPNAKAIGMRRTVELRRFF